MEPHGSRTRNPGIQAKHQSNRLYSRAAECTPERHGAHNTPGSWESDLPHSSLQVRPAPPRPLRLFAVRGAAAFPPAGYAVRMRRDSLPLSALGSVVSMRVTVGSLSPTSQRNLEKSQHSCHPGPHSHLHTCPVTSHSRCIPTRWASVRARPEGEREIPSSLQQAVLEEAGSTARPPPPPARSSPLPSPAGVGPVPEERRRPPQRPQEGRRRWAPQAMPLPGCSGGGRCERRRRGSRQGAAAAAAAAEGPRAGGGGGREGHRRRR